MKNLANCKPSEFLKQTSKIRKAVENWLTVTEIAKIRRNLPELEKITLDMSAEEKAEVQEKNRMLMSEKARENAMRILESILDDHPDETLEILALLCFVDPKNADDMSVEEYLNAFTEIINNQAVINFFTSLARLGNLNILTP